jgi:cyanophycinase
MKKRYLVFLAAWTLAASLLPGQAGAKGSLMIKGGNMTSALDRTTQRFIELGGGVQNIRLAIIAAGSVEPAVSGRENAADFIRLGVPAERIRIFPVAVLDDPSTKDVDESQWARNAFSEELAQEMLAYTAVYFGGGDQIRYNQTLKKANGEDSPLLKSIRKIFVDGGVIGGSSAGAAMMCDPMICEGDSINAITAGAAFKPDSCPEPKGVSLSTGLGFFTDGVVDQHFLKRGRVGRLLMALYALPKAWLGVGIDEDTAAIYHAGAIEVLGSSGVLVIDVTAAKAAGDLTWSTAEGLRAKGIILHYLEEGDRYDIAARAPLPLPERKTIVESNKENTDYPLETNLFGRDTFRAMMVDGMAENQKRETAGIAFTLDDKGYGMGSQWTLRKTERFAGLYASIKDVGTYTVTYVSLEVQPVSIRVKKIR